MRQPIPTQKLPISKAEILYWRNEIDASKKRQVDEFIKRINYDELVRYFEGIQVSGLQNLAQMAIMDEFSPGISSVIRSVIYQLPTVNITAENPLAEANVQPPLEFLFMHPGWKAYSRIELMKAAIIYAMKKGGFKEEFQLAAFDSLVAGFVCVEANHAVVSQGEVDGENQEVSEAEIPNPLLDSAVGVIRKGMDFVKKSIDSMTNQEIADEIQSEIPQERTDLTDSTYVKRWSPMDIFFDSQAIVFKESRFVIKRVRKSLAEFNQLYPSLKGKISSTSDALSTMTYRTGSAENTKSVTLWEIEIKRKSGRNRILVLADGLAEAADHYDRPIVSNGFSIKYGSIDKYGKIYPMSRAKKAKKPQDDINHYWTTQFEHVDRAQRKIGVWMGGLDTGGESALKSSDVYAIVPKKVPQSIFEAVPAPQVVPENKEIIAAMVSSVNKAIGTNEIAKTGQSENDLATQDVLEDKSFQSNSSAVQDALSDVGNEVIDAIKDIILQLWDEQDYFQVTGKSGGQFWYDPDMGPLSELLIGDYGASTDMASASRPNPMKDMQNAMALTQFIMAPETQVYLQARGKQTNLAPIENVIKQFGQTPDVMIEDISQDPMNPLSPAPISMPNAPGMVAPPPNGAGPKTPATNASNNDRRPPTPRDAVLRVGA